MEVLMYCMTNKGKNRNFTWRRNATYYLTKV